MKAVRIAASVAVLVGAGVLGASATAASLDPRAMGAATMATARDASAASGITLAGLTSQNYPTFFKVSANGRSLAVGAIALDMTCTSGAEFVLEDAVVRTRIARGGALHVGFALPPTAGSNGATYTATDSLRAHLNGKHSQLTGVWQLQVDYSFTNGMSDRCDSGPVRFVASG